MKYIKKLILSLLALAFIAGSTVPALAKDGTDDNGSDSTSSQTGTTPEARQETHAPVVNARVEHETELKNRDRAESIINELKDKNKKEVPDGTKRQNCENEKGGIKTKAGTLGTNAARYESKLDTTLQRAEDYQKTNNLTVTNWDSLVSAATAAQSKAAASVAALKALNVTIDCTQPSVATQVATIKAAALQARTDLLAYKQSVIALLTALENAKDQGAQQ